MDSDGTVSATDTGDREPSGVPDSVIKASSVLYNELDESTIWWPPTAVTAGTSKTSPCKVEFLVLLQKKGRRPRAGCGSPSPLFIYTLL